jgi:hypothetical protein
LAEKPLQIFGFKGVICKILRNKDLAFVPAVYGAKTWTPASKGAGRDLRPSSSSMVIVLFYQFHHSTRTTFLTLFSL